MDDSNTELKINDEENFKHLRDTDLNELIKTKGFMDLDLIEKVLEAKKREALIIKRRQ